MRARKDTLYGQAELFRARLENLIDHSHELVTLAERIDWIFEDEDIATHACQQIFLPESAAINSAAATTVSPSITMPPGALSDSHFVFASASTAILLKDADGLL